MAIVNGRLSPLTTRGADAAAAATTTLLFASTHMSVLEGGITGDAAHGSCTGEAGVLQSPF